VLEEVRRGLGAESVHATQRSEVVDTRIEDHNNFGHPTAGSDLPRRLS